MENKGLSITDHYELLSWLESNLRKGNFELVDEYLRLDNPERLDEAGILVALTITSHGKDKLPSRPIFLEAGEAILKKRLGEERAEKLLKYRR